jgi:hypothetical protein
LEAVIGREREKPPGTVQVSDSGASNSLEDTPGQALYIEHVHVLQPHQGPCCSLEVLEGWEILLHLLITILQSCEGRKYIKNQVVSI